MHDLDDLLGWIQSPTDFRAERPLLDPRTEPANNRQRTSASSKAVRISRTAASTSASDRRPFPRRFLNVADRRSDSALNTRQGYPSDPASASEHHRSDQGYLCHVQRFALCEHVEHVNNIRAQRCRLGLLQSRCSRMKSREQSSTKSWRILGREPQSPSPVGCISNQLELSGRGSPTTNAAVGRRLEHEACCRCPTPTAPGECPSQQIQGGRLAKLGCTDHTVTAPVPRSPSGPTAPQADSLPAPRRPDQEDRVGHRPRR